jgi:hypothetical protein
MEKWGDAASHSKSSSAYLSHLGRKDGTRYGFGADAPKTLTFFP